ncbi:MAG: DoxX family protein [Planctomycetes bacterium]|nr:DoxX family protein [Planctomycetota bacterium]
MSARRSVVTGRVLSSIAVAFLLFSASCKFFGGDMVRDGMRELGYPPEIAIGLGVLELLCTLLYAIPRTARLGAIVTTGYLGGAVATHLRLLHPWMSHTLFPVWLGMAVWAGLLLRDPAMRAVLLPPRLRTAS